MGRNITNIQQSSATANEVTNVTSATGFQAGDLIYNVNGAYGTIPDNFVSTASFNVSGNLSTKTGAVEGGYTQLVEGNNAGYLYGKCADKLTNGNVVVAWLSGQFTGRTTAAPYFKITDISNTQVVAPTLVSSAVSPGYSYYAQICVVALTGGGFAVAWRGANEYLYTAVYDNNGVQVTAPSASTTTVINSGYESMNIVALTNGGYAVAYWNSSATPNVAVQIYAANGTYERTYTYANTTNPGYSYQIGLAARLNGAVHEICLVCHRNASNNAVVVFNAATGVDILPSSISNGGTDKGMDVCVNTTDNYFVIVSSNSSDSSWYTVSTANSLSGGTVIPFSPQHNQAIYVKSLSAGGFAVLGTSDSTGTGNYVPSVFVYNGSYTLQTSTDRDIKGIYATYFPGVTIIENSNTLYFYQSPVANINSLSSSYSYNTLRYGWLYRYAFSLTSFVQAPITNISNTTIGTVSGVSVNGYARSGSNPNAASFLAASSSTQTVSLSQTSGTSNFRLAQTNIDTITADAIDSDTLSNGNAIVVYRGSVSPYPVKYAVYSQLGSLVTSGTVAPAGVANSWYQSVQVAALPNGKFVVTYIESSGLALNYVIYSSSYAVLSSGTFSLSGITLNSGNLRPTVAALQDSRFVICWFNANQYPTYSVFDDTATLIATGVGVSTTSYYSKVTGRPDGGFVIAATSVANTTVMSYAKSGTSTYVQTGAINTATSGSNYGSLANSLVCGADGAIFNIVFLTSSSACLRSYTFDGALSGYGATTSSWSSSSNSAESSVSITGSGLTIGYSSSDARYYKNYSNGMTSNSLTLSNYSSGTRALVSMTPCADNTVFIFLLNSSQQPTMAIINAYAQSYSSSLTGGVSASTTTALSPYSNRVSLIGVSSSECSAGGSGIVQTNGSAQLNSNYSASTTTQAFDFTVVPSVYGVKGFVSGRNVTMTKG